MRRIKEYKITTNRSVYNKLRKEYLEKEGKIHCSFCKYHKGENKNSYYGGFVGKTESKNNYKRNKIKYPSWKLIGKNKKQWMFKKLNFRYSTKFNGDVYCEINF